MSPDNRCHEHTPAWLPCVYAHAAYPGRMADEIDSGHDPVAEWPKGARPAQAWANPADPTLPPVSAGSAADRRAARVLADRLPGYGDPAVRPVQFAEAYAHLVAVSCARAEFYGILLADAYEREGVAALVGHKLDVDRFGDTHEVAEATRGLAALEAEERDRAAKLIREGVRLGIEAQKVDVMRSYGRTVVEALKALCGELGIPWEEQARRAAQRAILAARTTLGYQVAAPDRAGPPLTDDERARLTGGRHEGP